MFRNLKIGVRLGLGFGVVLALLLLTASIAVFQMTSARNEADAVSKFTHEEDLALLGLRTGFNRRAIGVRNLALTSDSAAQAAEVERIRSGNKLIDESFDKLDKLFTPEMSSPEQRDALKRLHEADAKYDPVAESIVKLATSGKQAEAATRIATECTPLFNAVLKVADEVASTSTVYLDTLHKANDAKFATLRAVIVGLALLAVALGVAIAVVVARSIVNPIRQAVTVAQTVAAGDLTSQIVSTAKDEPGELLTSLKLMNENLAKLVGTVRASSDSIATGSSQIATGNSDLSQRTEEQASNLQQTAASMEQLSSTVRNSADTARQASQLASSASSAATRGGEVVGQVVSTMNDITASSNRISDIIGVIDGIAFQTNILALNAAVEAARAGEQGRGFAVVASEVRVLAQRSADAAKEIKQLIGASAEKVEAGSRLVGDAGASMNDIVLQVKRVADLIGEISAAAIEQTSGIGQVSHAVTQLDQVTQQNAALVEESAAAAGSLSEQAARLVEAVSTFRLSHGAAVQTIARAQASSHAAVKPVAPRPVAPRPAASKSAASAHAPKPAAQSGDAFKAPASPKPLQESKGGDDDWVSF
jgi:methyl-accepting chemotaxis protein